MWKFVRVIYLLFLGGITFITLCFFLKRFTVFFLNLIFSQLKILTPLNISVLNYKFNYNCIRLENVIICKGRMKIGIDQVIFSFFRNGMIVVIKSNQVIVSHNITTNAVRENENNSSINTLYLYNFFRRVLITIFFILRKKVKIEIFNLILKRNGCRLCLIRNLIIQKGRVKFDIKNFINKSNSIYRIRGRIYKDSINYCIQAVFIDKSDIFSFEKNIGKFFFASKNFFSFSSFTDNLKINHLSISNEIIVIDRLKNFCQIDFTEINLKLADESFFEINTIKIFPKFSYNFNDSDFISSTLVFQFQLEAILKLIPNMKLSTLKMLLSTGVICITLKFAFLRSNPLSYNFKVSYDFENFTLISTGLNLEYLNRKFEFIIDDNEKNNPISIMINTETCFNHSLLAKVIQRIEDPNFYIHHGFDEYFIGKAIAINLSKGRFVKGASTLTMQLVKNLYLSNCKNVVRKVEEMILTILVENYFNISKERILEIYLQIIQFSPNTYGITNACKYYFGKDLLEINLMEAIVLSYVIPRPNFFLQAIKMGSEQLNRNLSKYIKHHFIELVKLGINHEHEVLSNKIYFSDEIGTLDLNMLDINELNNKCNKELMKLARNEKRNS